MKKSRYRLLSRSHRLLVTAALVVFLAEIGLPSSASAQATSPSRLHTTYLNKNSVILPIVMDPAARSQLKEIRLYVKDSPNQPWTLGQKATPKQTEFNFRAPRDGKYWFTMVTVDQLGRSSAQDLQTQAPQAAVIIDRHPPIVSIHANSNAEGKTIMVDVNDAHPDMSSLNVAYQTRDLVFRTLDPDYSKNGIYAIPRQAAFTGIIRVSVKDRCGNVFEKQMPLQECMDGVQSTSQKPNIAALPKPPSEDLRKPTDNSSMKQVQHTQPQQLIVPSKLPTDVKAQPNDLPVAKKTLPELPTQPKTLPKLNNPPQPQVTQQPKSLPLLQDTKKTRPSNVRPVSAYLTSPHYKNRDVVMNPRVVLNYEIEKQGDSGIGKVEIWMTSDQGQTWQRLAEDPDHSSPAAVVLPGQGMYGLTLVATNGLGFGGEPPTAGDRPDWVVEVDTDAPEARLLTISPIKGTQPGWVLVRWVASDKNLMDTPVTLSYATTPAGPWNTIARNIKNSGQYHWLVPPHARRSVYIRMTAVDRAGNIGHAQSLQPVQVDDQSRPVVRIQGVKQMANPKSH